jgi:hypothetical protein
MLWLKRQRLFEIFLKIGKRLARDPKDKIQTNVGKPGSAQQLDRCCLSSATDTT